jgi:tRNA threonylcarbamoyl adenosine modification protein YeaZ
LKILAIETSSLAASAAVWEDDKIVGEFYIDAILTHSQTILPMVRSLLECARVKIGDIGLFAVSNGPGSFTGLRIGLAATKGMAGAMGKPCVGVSSLEALAITTTRRAKGAGLSGAGCALFPGLYRPFRGERPDGYPSDAGLAPLASRIGRAP